MRLVSELWHKGTFGQALFGHIFRSALSRLLPLSCPSARAVGSNSTSTNRRGWREVRAKRPSFQPASLAAMGPGPAETVQAPRGGERIGGADHVALELAVPFIDAFADAFRLQVAD